MQSCSVVLPVLPRIVRPWKAGTWKMLRPRSLWIRVATTVLEASVAEQAPSVAVPPRLPLMVITSNRDGSTDKDARLVNCYLEVDDQGELWIYKRPGLQPNQLIAAA